MIRLESVLDSWKTIREDTAATVEEFPPAEFDFKAAPELMTFREITRHILEAGHGLAGLLASGEKNFTRPEFRQMMARHLPALAPEADGAALASALRQSVAGRTAELARMTPEFWAEEITRFDGVRVTRLEMLQTIKEHELTHRAQLFIYLRLKGLVPVTTRRRQARQARQ